VRPSGRDATPARELAGDLARAARVLAIRSRRESRGLFAGSYACAFRGRGMDFDESRPYAPGEDVRRLDWNAFARTGAPFVKRYREERDQLLLFALDVSASMRFGSGHRSQGIAAAHALALLAAAAGRAGDRVGLVAFSDTKRVGIPPGRGPAHGWRVIRSALEAASHAGGTTRIEAADGALRGLTREPAIVVLLSDFRWPGLSDDAGPLRGLAQRHEVVSLVLHDRCDENLPRAGRLRLADPEAPGRSLLVDSNDEAVRERYRRAARVRRARLTKTLNACGSDVLWLRGDRDPLQPLMHFFHDRAARGRPPRT